jgi:L-ribulose-5-phosphate 3-epimerase
MKIAVSAWSFHTPLYAGKLRQTDVPAEVAALGIRRVELLEMFLWRKPPGMIQRAWRRMNSVLRRGGTDHMPSLSPPSPLPLPNLGEEGGTEGGKQGPTVDYSRDTLNELRGARLRAGTQLACWAVDTDLTLTDADTRRAQLAHLATAIEAARFLGAPLLRITTGGQEGDAAVGQVVDTLRVLLPSAMAGGVKLAIENHFGLSADPHTLVEIVMALNSPYVGVCLDLGNFREGEANEGIRLLAPHAIHVHVKSFAFGPDGEETKINYRAAMQVLHSAGYDGVLSIEFEGDGSPADGIRKTKALIERYW